MPSNTDKKNIVRSTTELGALIRRIRKEQGLTQAQVAGFCNVGLRFFSELENGKPTARLELVLKVIKILGLDLALEKR